MRTKATWAAVIVGLFVASFAIGSAARLEAGVVKAMAKNHYACNQSMFGKIRHHHIMNSGGGHTRAQQCPCK